MCKVLKNKRYNELRIALDVLKQACKPEGVTTGYLVKKYGLKYSTSKSYIDAVLDGDTSICELENVDDNYRIKHYGYLPSQKKPEYINLKDIKLSRAYYGSKCFKPTTAVIFIRDLLNAVSINRHVVQLSSDQEHSYIKYTFRVPNSKVYKGVANEKE